MKNQKYYKGLVIVVLEWGILFVGLLGLVINFATSSTFKDGLNLFSYYTIQSNLAVVILISIRIYYRIHKKTITHFISILTSATTSWLLVTGLGFILLLSAIYHPEGIKMISNISLHYVTPTLMLIYFFFSENKVKIKKTLSLLFISYPLAYCIISLIRGGITGFYPYWFLNPTIAYPEGVGSLLNVLLIFIGVAIIFTGIGYLLLWLHKKINGENID